MKWPWSRRNDDAADKRAEELRLAEAEAVKQAQRRLEDARRAEPRVNRLLAQLHQLGDPDEFARRLAGTFRDRR